MQRNTALRFSSNSFEVFIARKTLAGKWGICDKYLKKRKKKKKKSRAPSYISLKKPTSSSAAIVLTYYQIQRQQIEANNIRGNTLIVSALVSSFWSVGKPLFSLRYSSNTCVFIALLQQMDPLLFSFSFDPFYFLLFRSIRFWFCYFPLRACTN